MIYLSECWRKKSCSYDYGVSGLTLVNSNIFFVVFFNYILFHHHQKIDEYKWKHQWIFSVDILRWFLLIEFFPSLTPSVNTDKNMLKVYTKTWKFLQTPLLTKLQWDSIKQIIQWCVIYIGKITEGFTIGIVARRKTPRGVPVLAMAVFSLCYWNWFCWESPPSI